MNVLDRLARLGPGALTDHELLSTVLGEGCGSEAWLSGAGGFRGLALLPWDRLVSLTEVGGTLGAARLSAAMEVGRRALRSRERRPRLTTPAEVYRYLVPELGALRREVFHVLSFNVRQVLLSDARVAIGSAEHCSVDPREVYAEALSVRAHGVILAHNHPSGSRDPSADDWSLNEELRAGFQILGIRLLDHLIVGDEGFTSLMLEARQMKIAVPDGRRPGVARPGRPQSPHGD